MNAAWVFLHVRKRFNESNISFPIKLDDTLSKPATHLLLASQSGSLKGMTCINTASKSLQCDEERPVIANRHVVIPSDRGHESMSTPSCNDAAVRAFVWTHTSAGQRKARTLLTHYQGRATSCYSTFPRKHEQHFS